MKKSINYWSFPGGLEGTQNIAECFAQAKDMGYEAVELCVGEAGALHLKTSQKQCERIRADAETAGVEISSIAAGFFWGYNFASNRVSDRNRAEQATKKALQIGAWLGVDAMLVIPGAVDVFFDPGAEVIPYDTVHARVKQGLARVVKTAEQCGVALCIENVWNKFAMSPLELRDLVDGFKSEFVGVYFDVGNVMAIGYPEQWIRILGKRIKRVHFKDYKVAVGTAEGFCDLLEGDVNWPEVMRALRGVGYNGYCAAEMIPLYKHYPLTRLVNASRAMDAIFSTRTK